MSENILTLMGKRHSYYEINNVLPIKKEEITAIIHESLKLYPSPFNSQAARLIVLFNKKHQSFWQLVAQELLKTAPAEKSQDIRKKIASFAAGYGTILYFMDTDIIKKQEQKMPLYAANFKNWGYQSNAMLQFMIWSALTAKHIGASLQHYNPLIDEAVQDTFNVNPSWELVAQMPFGGIITEPEAHKVQEDKDICQIFE